MTPVNAIATLFGIKAREFAAGWAEGTMRMKAAGAPDIVPGSHFQKGTVSFAASQAAVSYLTAMET